MADLPELRLELARLQWGLSELPRPSLSGPYGHGYGGVRRRFGFLLSDGLLRRLDERCAAEPGPTWRRLRSMVRDFQLLDQVQQQTESWIGLRSDSPEALATREEAYCRVVQSTLRHQWGMSWLEWEQAQHGGDYGRLRAMAVRYAEALRQHRHPGDLPFAQTASELPVSPRMRQPAAAGLAADPREFTQRFTEDWLNRIGSWTGVSPLLLEVGQEAGEARCRLIRPGRPAEVICPPITHLAAGLAFCGALLAGRIAGELSAQSPIEEHCSGDRSHLLAVELLGRLAIVEMLRNDTGAALTLTPRHVTRMQQLLRGQLRTALRRVPVIIDALEDTSAGWRDIPGRWGDPLSREPRWGIGRFSWTQALVRHGGPVAELRAWLLALAFREELLAELGTSWAISAKLGEAVRGWYIDRAERDAIPDQSPRAWQALEMFLGCPTSTSV